MCRALIVSIWFLLLADGPFAEGMASGQTIPNPNRDRLGMPPNPVSAPSSATNQHRTGQLKSLHAEALRDADELYTRVSKLRDELRSAGDYVVPVSAMTEAERIEKLAHKLRSQLKN